MLAWLPIFWGQLKARELEARRHRATDERPVAERFGCLPGVHRHRRLRTFAGVKIGSEHHALDAPRRLRNLQREWRTRIPVPDFDRVNAMPVRTLTACEQKVDRGGRRAPIHLPRIAE